MGDAGSRALEAARNRRTSEAGDALPAADGLFGAPVISLTREADELIDALMNEAMLELAWEDHGFRDPSAPSARPKPAAAHANARFDRRCAAMPRRPR